MASLQRETHNYSKKHRRLIQQSRKLGCSAKIFVRHVLCLPDYECSSAVNEKKTRENLSAQYRKDWKSGAKINFLHRFYILLPSSHTAHDVNEASDAVQNIDKRLASYIKSKVQEGNISTTKEMKLLLREHLIDNIYKGKTLPLRTNTRFWPTSTQIRNHMLLSVIRSRDSTVDQENLRQLVTAWEQQQPADKFHLQLKEDGAEDNQFLFVYQTEWQRRLLARYGNELCLLDATYRTSKYSLPLFLLVVPTNVNYMVVGCFIVECETQQAIASALQILREWNVSWRPAYFMTDFAEEEIGAVKSTFNDTNTFVYLCDFHRIQSWNRWLKSHGLNHEKENILQKFKAIADAMSDKAYQESLVELQKSDVWIQNPQMQLWFTNKWLSNKERWVRFHRQNRLNVYINTTNGVERQNCTLKWGYLWTSGAQRMQTVSALCKVIVCDFLPDAYTKYVTENVKCSSQTRKYSEDIPVFLKDRPSTFVQHEMHRWISAQELKDQVLQKENGITVRSGTCPGKEYCVKIDDGNGLPACECEDWLRYHLPCKHILAVIASPAVSVSWDDLPEAYRNSPFLTLDITSGPMQYTTVHCQSPSRPLNSQTELQANNDSGNLETATRKMTATASKLRSHVREIENLSFMCKDVKKVEEAEATLRAVCQSLREACPSEGPFTMEPQVAVPITTKDKIRKLAKRKRSKKAVNTPVGSQKSHAVHSGSITSDIPASEKAQGSTTGVRKKKEV